MTSSFVLTTDTWGWAHTKAITAHDFQRARSAVDQLLSCLDIEEAFAIVIANYVDFEKAVAGANIESMVERNTSRSVIENRRREIDRHLVNLLAAGEMFTEHVRRRIKRGYGRSSKEFSVIEDALGLQRDRLAGFKATEHLRDAVLHNSLPVTSWTISSRWINLEGPDGSLDKRNPSARHEHSVTFSFDPELLALDRNVDRDLIITLKDRADHNGKVSWVPVAREYVEALSLVQKEVRLTLEPSEHAAIKFLSELCDEYRSALPVEAQHPHYVFAVERDEKNWINHIVLNLGLDERILELRLQHRPMLNLHRSGLKT